MTPQILGSVAPGFEPVAEAFRSAFNVPQMGASLCVYYRGRPVVDLWGGIADARSGAPWARDTISVIFSCTKGLMSILLARLVEEGRLDYDAPVSRYWPEFAQSGKADLLVRQAVSHQAGLSAPADDFDPDDILDWSQVTARLARQAPLWRPGSGYAYHALTHGWLTGELVRRVTGQSVSDAFCRMIADPLSVDAWIGLPASEHARVAHLSRGPHADPPPMATGPEPDWPTRATTMGRALPSTLIEPDGGFNNPRLWAAEIPGAGCIASARAIAKIWSATVVDTDGVRLLHPQIVARATAVETAGPPVFPAPPPYSRWGMGFQLDSDSRRYVTAAGFGHDGAGGQVAFAEPGLGLGFAFLTNVMEGSSDQRGNSLVDAVRALPAIRNTSDARAAAR